MADRGRMVGQLYAANTVGAILGALAFSLWLIPAIGTQQSQRLLMVGAACAAALCWVSRDVVSSRRGWIVASIAALAGLCSWSVAEMPFKRLAFGRIAEMVKGDVTELYRGEGMNSTVAVAERGPIRSFHVSGKIEASNLPDDMRVQHMLSNLPAIIHPEPKSVLVVGFGAGVTAGLLLPHMSVKRIVICEIERLIPTQVGPLFEDQNLGVAKDEAVEIVYDDARHFVATTPERFDIITSDSIHPWVKGAATLYTQEYYERMRDHLNDGGIAIQWLPLYDTNREAIRSAIATFFRVFPHGSVWSNAESGKSFDVVLLGTREPLKIDLDALEARMDKAHFAVRLGLQYVGFGSALDLLATYATEADDLAEWLKDAPINRDRNLRLQYLAGLTPYGVDFRSVHEEIMSRSRFPSPLFTGSESVMEALRLRIERAAAKRAK